MNKYYLKILHPGMSFIRETVRADGFYTLDDGYYFFINEFVDGGETRRITKSVYPICLTIIEKIEEK
jgi:hypothetical protein